jgi:hypothetical protein
MVNASDDKGAHDNADSGRKFKHMTIRVSGAAKVEDIRSMMRDVGIVMESLEPSKVRHMDPTQLESAVSDLNKQIDLYFNLVAATFYDDLELQKSLLQRLGGALLLLKESHANGDKAQAYIKAMGEVKSIEATITHEDQLRQAEHLLRWIVPAIVIVYILALATTIAHTAPSWTSSTEMPLIGIPISVILWAAIGSIAAILYRFYTYRRSSLQREIRWLIARPVIGIVIGAMAYTNPL